MKTRAKAALAVAAAVIGAGGGLSSVDCYEGTVFVAGQYRTEAECVPRGKAWMPVGVVVASEKTLLPGIAGDFECACSIGKACAVGGKPAPLGNTLAAGTWSGDGCVRKSCVELAGKSSWPGGCPQ